MAAYLTRDDFKLRTLAPASYVLEIEQREPGWLGARLELWSSYIDARLRKRYAVPFSAPYPIMSLQWLERIVTLDLYLKRGVDPTDAQFDLIRALADSARTELDEASNAVEGRFDLPLRSDTTSDGITKGGALGYTEQSPYTWTQVQLEAVGNHEP